MYRTMLKSKIHRATVTHADLHYVGSVTVDRDLLDAADLLPGELVAIVDVTNGARLETYVIEGERGSGVIGINGAAAHLVHPGDLVILISYVQVDYHEAAAYEPRIVHVDPANRIVALGTDAGQPVPEFAFAAAVSASTPAAEAAAPATVIAATAAGTLAAAPASATAPAASAPASVSVSTPGLAQQRSPHSVT